MRSSQHDRRPAGSSLWLLLAVVAVGVAMAAPVPAPGHRSAPAEQGTVQIA